MPYDDDFESFKEAMLLQTEFKPLIECRPPPTKITWDHLMVKHPLGGQAAQKRMQLEFIASFLTPASGPFPIIPEFEYRFDRVGVYAIYYIGNLLRLGAAIGDNFEVEPADEEAGD
jgi:hypothetical protein